MSKPVNSIEINGRRYDAQTGQPLASVTARRKGSVDGIISHKKTPTVTLATPKIKAAQPIQPLSTTNTKLMDMKAPKSHATRTAAKPAAKHTPQPSQALMRHVVQKPGKSLKRQHVAHGHTDKLVAKPVATVVAKHSIHTVHPARITRAHQTLKSPKVSRFGSRAPHIAVVSTPIESTAVSQPLIEKPLDIFEQALARATSHEQPAFAHHKHPKRQKLLAKRRTSVAATALSVLLLVGFIGIQNRAALDVRMAASKAGFNATMPGYKPSGFSVGKLSYSPGTVAINYHSNSDDRAFAVVEKPSAWDSSTLRDTVVAPADDQYQTVGVAGRTVYLYGNNNATWVSGGVLYQVKTDGALSNKQISKIAESL